MAPYGEIIAAEDVLNALLPVSRLQQSVSPALINAAKAWSNTVWAAAEKLGPIPLSTYQLATGHALARYPVFICGVHRSGTTLVRDILDDHPDLVVLPSEGTFYTNIEVKLNALPADQRMPYMAKEWLRRLANPINQSPYWLLGRSTTKTSAYVDFARYVMAWWHAVDRANPQWPHQAIVLAYASCQNKLSAKYWVDKTPVNERYLKRIWRENPGAKIIQVIRNPVDTLSSRKKMEPGVTMRTALIDMKTAFRVAFDQQKINDARFLQVYYEAICEQPQHVIDQILNFLAIAPSTALLQPSVAGMPSQANSSFNTNTVKGEILKLARQPDILTFAEKKLLAAYLGKLSGKLEYPLVPVTPFTKCYLWLSNRLFI